MTNHYVRQGATGSNNGTDWTNAWTDINLISGIVSGDIIYIAAGTYIGTYTASANGWTIQRATISEHGTSTEWNNNYDGIVNINSATGTNVFTLTNYYGITINGIERTKFIIYGDNNRRPKNGIISILNSKNITIQNITIHGMADAGIKFRYATGGVKILNSEIYKCGDGNSEDTDALIIWEDSWGTDGWNEIAYNYIHDSTYADSNTATDFIACAGTHMLIHDNTIFNGWSTANSADFVSVRAGKIYIYNNLFLGTPDSYNQRVFISGWNRDIDDIRIYNNIFYQQSNTTSVSVGLNIRQDFGYTLTNVYVMNNTFYGQDWAIRTSQIVPSSAVQNLVIKNNIFHADTWYILDLEQGDTNQFTIDYNYYYHTPGTRLTNLPASTLAGLRSTYGWEIHGSEGEPEFDSIDQNGFRLTSLSPFPLINGGENLSTLFTFDKNNTPRPPSEAWDIGAYEYTQQCPTPIASFNLNLI